jgi:sigma-B regulation protein RsbU (phosphoserine phosphatase)
VSDLNRIVPPRKRVVLLVNDVFSAYQATYRASIERVARRLDIGVLVMMGRELMHEDPSERVQNAIYDWVSPELADGALLLSGTLANFTGLEGITALCTRMGGLPIVSIGLAIPGCASIHLDNMAAQSVAVEHLVGHHQRKKIAYIAGPPSNEEAAERLAAYRGVMRKNGIDVDERQISVGHFTIPSGRRAMRELLARGVPFDSVVAANDAMALGALDVLMQAGIRVPEDALLIGFDDTPIARFAPRSLTTVAQPVDDVVEAAFADLLVLMGAERASARPSFDAELVLRESCGCGYGMSRTAPSRVGPKVSASVYLRASREEVTASTRPSDDARGHGGRIHWIPGLVDALVEDLEGKEGVLARHVERAIDEASARHSSLEEIGHAVIVLQRHLDHAGYSGASHFEIEQLFMKVRAIVTAAVSRKEARAALNQVERAVELRYATQRLSLAFDRRSLAAELERSLPLVGVETAYIALRGSGAAGTLRPLLAMEAKVAAPVALVPQSPRRLLPDGFPSATAWSLLVWAVTFEAEFMGIIALDGGADPLVGEAVRAQIGAALKMGELHAQVVEQTTLQERLGRERLDQEMAMARTIQTALAPKDLRATALDIGAGMRTADVVGGDYFDVLPVKGGCWIAIGDVAGHGLMSGLVMLMIQSIVSTLVMSRPDATPAELCVEVNRVLFANLRGRLQRQEHATFLLLRVPEDGRVRFAGAHEDVVVWRSRERRCELVPTEGTWLGLVEDIAHATADQELRLEPGDLLVLLTDGVLEARNAKNEHFGIDPVCRIIEGHADSTPQTIVDEIIAATRAWAPAQQDDVTCVVARFTGARPTSSYAPAAPKGERVG